MIFYELTEKRIVTMIKIMLRTVAFMGISFFALLNANSVSEDRIEFSGREVVIPGKLGDIKLYKDCDGFHVIKNDEVFDVRNYDCNELREMTDEQLKTFLGRDKPQLIRLPTEEFDRINIDNCIEITGDAKDEILNALSSGGGYIAVNQ